MARSLASYFLCSLVTQQQTRLSRRQKQTHTQSKETTTTTTTTQHSSGSSRNRTQRTALAGAHLSF
jgi:hypothetical protein